MKQANRHEDQILIPTENGFVAIPANGLRSTATDQQQKSMVTLNLILMKVKNYLQFSLMITGMTAIMAAIGFTIAGSTGVVMAFVAVGLGFFLTSHTSIAHILTKKEVRYIHPSEGGVVYGMLEKLIHRAGIVKMPALFLDNSPEINAYTLEDKEQAAIVISKGLANSLTHQELFGVLAHEIAHLKNNDIRIMLLSEQLRKLTGYMALFGQILLVFNLPFILLNQVMVPWITIILLITAPIISLLFQVAVSRNREFKADIDAAVLAEDTKGLSQALAKITLQSNFWKKLYTPYFKNTPEIFRTHPNTHARIQRLKALEASRENELGWS